MLTDDKPVKVVISELFLKDIKDLAKSYRSVRKDILPLIDRLSDGEIIGDRLKGFDYQVYKVR
jgi:mRNA-degrading endonuclease RelE of RelBE toxin-antitoxin system